ncbi:MAG: hypothetical protein IJX84_03320 [Clostridia bacterium]|nr:hypothetical protein [Clostridia bacterium]
MEKASSFLFGAEADTSLSSMIDASFQIVNEKMLSYLPKIAAFFDTKLFFEATQGLAVTFEFVTLKMTVSYIYNGG